MTPPPRHETITERRAVLFADLGDSTRLYEQLGDRRAHEIATGCLSQLEAVATEFDGHIIKHIGDEVMCEFANPNDAVSAAREMQERVSAPVDELGLTIHIGVHWGPVLVERGDVFGDAVNLAARMVGLAHPRQILTTGDTVAALTPELQQSTRLIDHRRVKGKQADVDVYEVVWERAEDRTEFKGVPPSEPAVTELRVLMGATEVRAGADKPTVTIGRDTSNDLVILDSMASRQHARIEMLAQNWVLTDKSINGTVVALDDGASIVVHNEQILLPSAGWLGIGCKDPATYQLPVRFEQLQAQR